MSDFTLTALKVLFCPGELPSRTIFVFLSSFSSFCVLEALESSDFVTDFVIAARSSFDVFGDSFGDVLSPLEPLEFSFAIGGGLEGGVGFLLIPTVPDIPARRPAASTPGKLIPD